MTEKRIRLMKKWLNKRNWISFCLNAVLAAEVLMLIDGAVVYTGKTLSISTAAGLLAVLTALCCLIFRRNRKRILTVLAAIPVVLSIAAAAGFACWKLFSITAGYQNPDSGKVQIYGDRRVMVIVPHQDDELNILGGVLEEYVRYGSEVYAVFVTNGDYYGVVNDRYREALAVFEKLGVPEDQVIFLGYGDNWREDGPHIYNAASGAVLESYIGQSATYGTSLHPAYREGRAYTIDNLAEDFRDVILEVAPDIIFCTDYDRHIDHKGTTLLFDKVMGVILKEKEDYRPVVYKSYAYGTAWEAETDFYAQNIRSTQNLFAEPYLQKPVVYRWDDRIRFPVKGDGLSRSLIGSEQYEYLSLHESQLIKLRAASIVNGDRVTWQRYTDSLCLSAEIEASSGQPGLLNDFMLIENHDLRDESRLPYDGVWIPEDSDSEKTVTVTFAAQSDVFSVVLYDHPSEEHNILNAVITFEDGTKVETGPLDPYGAATSIRVNKEQISAFSVAIAESEGELAGLSEIEAFAEEPRPDGRFIKLMDENGDFLYDYWTEKDGTALLSLHLHGDLPALTAENYWIGTDSELASAVLEDGVIRVNCPVGEAFVLNVTCDGAGVSDSIHIRNPGRVERMWVGLWQKAEEEVYTRYSRADQKNLLIFTIPEKISYVIRQIL